MVKKRGAGPELITLDRKPWVRFSAERRKRMLPALAELYEKQFNARASLLAAIGESPHTLYADPVRRKQLLEYVPRPQREKGLSTYISHFLVEKMLSRKGLKGLPDMKLLKQLQERLGELNEEQLLQILAKTRSPASATRQVSNLKNFILKQEPVKEKKWVQQELQF